MDLHESTSTSTSTSTTTSTSTKQRSLKRKTGDEDNGATPPALEDGFIEDGLAPSAANLAMRAIRTRRAKRRRANARSGTMDKVTPEEEEQEEDGEEEEVMGKAVAEEIGGGSLHLCGGSGGRDGKRKKPARQAKNVLNFISYVPPAPAPNRKKNLHSSPRLLAWLRENFEAVRGTSLAKDEVYGEYVAFCQADGKDPMLPSMFGKMVHRAFPGLKSSRTGAKGKAKHCYKGFRVRAPSGKPSMVVTSIYDDNEEEEELIEDAAEFDDEDSCANPTSASRPSQSTTFSSPSLPYGAVPVSGSSSSSSPNSSPVRAQGRRRPSPAGGGRLNSPSSSINGDGYFSSPHVLPPAGAPSPPFATAVDRTGVVMPPFPHHSRESFLGMLQSSPQAIDAPLGQHHSLRSHLPMGSPVAPPHLQQLALLHQHQHQQQQHAQYPPHHPASGMPLPRSYPSHYSYAPLQYPSPNGANASPLPPAGALHQPSSSTQPSRTPPQQMPLHQGEEGEQPGSPIDCVPSPTSDFYFPPYISPLSVPLPFLPSFSFSLPPSSPQPSTSTPPVRGMASERQDVLQSQHRSSMMDQPGLDSFSNSSSAPSSSSSSPSQDATLCYEREINGPLYASLPEEGFGIHAHLAHHPTQQQQRLLQQQQQQQQLYPTPSLCPTDYVLRAHDAHRYAQSLRQGDRNARHQTAKPAGNGVENGSYAPQEQQRPDGQRG